MAAYTTIDDPEAYFQVKAYTGNGTAIGSGGQSLTLDGDTDLSPNMIWFKERNSTSNHALFDTVRGATKYLIPDGNYAEATDTETLTAFNSDGFTVGSASAENRDGNLFVAWCWKESADAGFDIVSYAGNATNRDISHSLSAVPAVMLIKNLSATLSWRMYHHQNTAAPETDHLILDTTAATADDDSMWNDTAPTSSVFSLKTSTSVNGSSANYIAYVFTGKQGFSKFGQYKGNGNADGAFIFCGFRPAFVMMKRTNTTSEWGVFDNKRDVDNVATLQLKPNASEVEEANGAVDFCANGFKLRATSVFMNGDDDSYVFMAFAEAPLVNSNGVPGNAR